jgi:hypothetical protein
MYESKLLREPRVLTENELQQINLAQSKWHPELFQTYQTTLFGMMASPFKKSLIYLVILIILLFIGLFIYKQFIGSNTKSDNNLIKIYGFIGLIFILFSVFGVGIKQYKLNQNVMLVMTLAKPNATKYDYESSDVIQSQLMRNAYRRGSGSSTGSGILGGLVGYGIGKRR